MALRYLTYERGARIIAGDFVEVPNPAVAPVSRERFLPAPPSAD
jgi:hypothetical protein